MFVERVTREQMKMFLETFACCSEQKNLVMRLNYAGKEPYLDVTRYSNGMMYTDSYYDFDSTYCSNLWNKFLYTQFTHEYYSAFKAHLLEDVEKKLTNMIKIRESKIPDTSILTTKHLQVYTIYSAEHFRSISNVAVLNSSSCDESLRTDVCN